MSSWDEVTSSLRKYKNRQRPAKQDDDEIPGVHGDDSITADEPSPSPSITPEDNSVNEDRAAPSPSPEANPNAVADKAKEEEADTPWAFKRLRSLLKR